MPRIAGNSGTLVLAGVTKLGITNIKWNPTRELPDATGMDSGGYKENVDGNAGATFTGDAHWDTAAGGDAPSILVGGSIAFELTTDAVPARTYSGNCRLSAVPVDISFDGTVDYTVEGTVQGLWAEV